MSRTAEANEGAGAISGPRKQLLAPLWLWTGFFTFHSNVKRRGQVPSTEQSTEEKAKAALLIWTSLPPCNFFQMPQSWSLAPLFPGHFFFDFLTLATTSLGKEHTRNDLYTDRMFLHEKQDKCSEGKQKVNLGHNFCLLNLLSLSIHFILFMVFPKKSLKMEY